MFPSKCVLHDPRVGLYTIDIRPSLPFMIGPRNLCFYQQTAKPSFFLRYLRGLDHLTKSTRNIPGNSLPRLRSSRPLRVLAARLCSSLPGPHNKKSMLFSIYLLNIAPACQIPYTSTKRVHTFILLVLKPWDGSNNQGHSHYYAEQSQHAYNDNTSH